MPFAAHSLLGVSLLLCAPAAAHAHPGEAQGGGSMAVSVVGQRLIVSCDLSTAANRIPVNLFVELEGRHGLQLANKAAAGLKAETSDGKPRPITMHFGDFEVVVPARELGDEDLFAAFTKYHSAEMGENALVGSIGVEVLRDWDVTLRVGDGQIDLSPIQADAPAPPMALNIMDDGTVVAPLTLIDDMAWIPVRWSDGAAGGLMVGTAVYDTRIDARAAARRGRPAGDVGPIKLADIDLHRYVAFRPEPVVQVHPDSVVGVTGVNLLRCLEVSLDRSKSELRVRPVREAQFPDADLQFFQARADEDPDAVLGFLEEHPEERLAGEAARLLLDYRIEDAAPSDEIDSAVQWVFETEVGDLRTTRMLDLMKEMSDAGEVGVVIAAGRLGVDAGRDDRYPNAVHEVHGLLGRTLLDEGEGDEAWRHLLSAAFGLPEDGSINLDLGRFYEQQGRYRRAFSRYVQAVIRPESGAGGLEGLQRVQSLLKNDEGDAEPFSVRTIERMIAGKVRNFGASSRFVPDEENPALRTVLCEFFTNGHLGSEERGGAIGGALAFEGLEGRFDPEHVVLLQYHLPAPQPDALCSSVARTRASVLGVGDPTVMVLDGKTGSPGAGRWRQAEAIYDRARKIAVKRMAKLTDYDVDISARIEGDRVVGSAIVTGAEETGLRVQVVLAEAAVLYPGSSGVVVHRHVARASLLGDDMGAWFEPEEFEQEFSFDRSLTEIESEQVAFLGELEAEGLGTAPLISTRVDPAEARVVAFLYDGSTGEVLAAYSVKPTAADDAAGVTEPSEEAPQDADGAGSGGR